MSIHILSNEVINQIAAGEVVERPAHMVKELVENALDAGSTHIHIEVKEGGRDVLVRDDGSGIEASQLEKALLRHSTSKISKSDDLWALSSYGFRGEALASIAAVSDLSLSSRPKHQEHGARVVTQFGAPPEKYELGHALGTEVRVQNLFGNLPARLKFLKSGSAEVSQIRQVIRAMALVTPHIEWRFIVEGKLDQYFPIHSDLERVAQILDLKTVFAGEATVGAYRAKVYMADPHETVKSNRSIWLFVQNRWVQDRSLVAAVMEGYRNVLMHHEYPQIMVTIQGEPSELDVNIHPTKSQVKFQNPSDAFRSVVHAIRQVLEQAPWLPQDSKLSGAMPDLLQDSSVEAVRSDDLNKSVYVPAHLSQMNLSAPQFQQTHFRTKYNNLGATQSSDKVTLADLKSVAQSRHADLENIKKQMDNSTLDDSADLSMGYWQSLQVIGQAGLTYIVCQDQNGLVLIDQHAADERVRFETISKSLASGQIIWQNLLFPLVIDLSPEKKEVLLLQKERLENLGLQIEEMGPASISVHSHAEWVKESKLPELLSSLAAQILDQGESFLFESYQAEWMASQACHGAIRAGKALTLLEIRKLLQEMDQFPLSSFCPHGRPVAVTYSFGELDRDFGRIVT